MVATLPTLDIPKQSISDSTIVDGRPKAVQAELDGLPLANVPVALKQAQTLLSLLNRTRMGQPARAKILSLFEPVYQVFETHYRNHINGIRNGQNLSIESCHRLLTFKHEMAVGYKILLLEAKGTQAPGIEQAQLIYQIIYYQSQALLQYMDDYQWPSALLRAELNQLYAFAENHHLHHIQISHPATQKPDTIDDLFKQLLLVEICNPYHLMPGESWLIHNYLGKWAHHARLEALHGEHSNSDFFYIDLASSTPPHNSFDQTLLQRSSMRRLNIAKLATLVEQHIKALTTERGVAAIGLDEKLDSERASKLLLDALQCWEHRFQRAQKRLNCDAFTGIIWGLQTVHELLDPKHTAAILSPSNPYKATGTMINESDRGFCMALPEKLSNNFHNGQLLAMRCDRQTNPQWILGLIRWQQAPSSKRFLIGVEYLKGTLQPALIHHDGEYDTENLRPALLLTANQNEHQQYRLITPLGVYRLGRELTLNLTHSDRCYVIEANHLWEHTPLFDVFTFRTLSRTR